jgi:hypothetical protein
MKNLALIFYIFLFSSYGQDIEDIKKLDTVYVKFKKYKSNQRRCGGLSFYTIRLGEVLREHLYISSNLLDEKL